MYLLFSGVEREISHVECRRILELVFELRRGIASEVIVAAIVLSAVLERHERSFRYVHRHPTLLVAYELGLSRRSTVFRLLGAIFDTGE